MPIQQCLFRQQDSLSFVANASPLYLSLVTLDFQFNSIGKIGDREDLQSLRVVGVTGRAKHLQRGDGRHEKHPGQIASPLQECICDMGDSDRRAASFMP
jgi:hypothetical protein